MNCWCWQEREALCQIIKVAYLYMIGVELVLGEHIEGAEVQPSGENAVPARSVPETKHA